MAEHMNLYERARYYDVIFNREVSREVRFLTDAFRVHAGRSGPGSVLDIACGPGYHARAFARQGARAVGMDLNEAMIELAREKDRQEGLDLTWLVADMRQFELDQPVDLAFIMFDGLDALLTHEDLLMHLQAVALNLSPGGIYVIDLTHPRDCSFQDYGEFVYQGARNGIEVEIEWAINEPRFDLLTGVAEVEIEMRINDHGEKTIVRDKARERLLLPQEIQLLCHTTGGIEVAGWYGDFEIGQGLDWSPQSRRMIAVLQAS